MIGELDGEGVAALYVEKGGCYFGLPGVDPWDQKRDARLYAGPWPVVAHPPCQRWGKLWAGQPLWIKRTGERKIKGDDGGCFAAALAAVRQWGGVLEHPWGSHAWPHFGLNVPPRSGGWVAGDFHGGWTCCVEQGRYGHYARKPTLLYAIGVDLPELRWGKDRTAIPHVGDREIRPRQMQARRGAGVQGWRHGQLAQDRHARTVPRPSARHGAICEPQGGSSMTLRACIVALFILGALVWSYSQEPSRSECDDAPINCAPTPSQQGSST